MFVHAKLSTSCSCRIVFSTLYTSTSPVFFLLLDLSGITVQVLRDLVNYKQYGYCLLYELPRRSAAVRSSWSTICTVPTTAETSEIWIYCIYLLWVANVMPTSDERTETTGDSRPKNL